jgi:serine/threonine protein phosphatase PrpC
MNKNYFAVTNIGKVRDNNEDTFVAEETADKNYIIACVIDGVGGYNGGEVASAIASQKIIEHLKDFKGDSTSSMKAAIHAANEEIILQKSKVKTLAKMACVLTLVVVDVEKNQFSFAHVGDTRLYLLRDQSLVKISKDQSFVGFMEDSGRLTEEEAMRHPKRNEINKALGFDIGIASQDDYLDMGSSPFLPGDLILLCSDGLSDMVNKQDMTKILIEDSSLEEKATKLVQAANDHGGLDNITLVLVKNDNQAKVFEVEKPIIKKVKKNPTIVHEPIPEISQIQPLEPLASPNKSSNKKAITVLSLLLILFVVATGYLLYNRYLNKSKAPLASTIKPPRNPQEKKLQDTIDELKGNILVLSDSLFKSPILITAPLNINRDTLYLIAEKNLIIKSDSSFKGIPIQIDIKNKHLLLQNLSFEDFDTAISTQSNALVLKNVSFKNCPNAIKRVLAFPTGKYINGKMPNSVFRIDSLPLSVTN